MWPWGGAIFGPRDIIWTNLEKVQQVMLHNKYKGSRTCGFRQEDLFNVFPYLFFVIMVSVKKIFPCFSLYRPVLNMWSRGGVIFGPRGII